MNKDTSDESYCLMKNGILLRAAKTLIRDMDPEGVISQDDINKLIWSIGMLEDRIAGDGVHMENHPVSGSE